jgi:hypothetical protein
VASRVPIDLPAEDGGGGGSGGGLSGDEASFFAAGLVADADGSEPGDFGSTASLIFYLMPTDTTGATLKVSSVGPRDGPTGRITGGGMPLMPSRREGMVRRGRETREGQDK